MATTFSTDYGFNEIKIYRDHYLGSGAYGIVCKAKCDQLPCAAKLLHPTFLVPGNWAADKFMQECSFLASLKHPHIVQFLGLHTEPSSGQVALLMELMDESLTSFLERYHSTGRSVPLYLQVNMSHDVILALQYLHSNGIIHRDLSSNNVLLLGECRAKVTDFGMSKLTCNSSPLSSLTQVPGCPVYMPPEAWINPPVYTEKLDIFSLGVLVVQMITCCLPNPGPLEVLIADERSPTGFMKLPVSELDRRSEDIAQISSDHLLKDIALECLTDRAEQRPTSKDLCQKLETLKISEHYQDSKDNTGQLVSEVPTDGCDSSHKMDSLEKTIKEKEMELQKKKERIVSLEGEVKSLKGIVSEKDSIIEKLKAELKECKTATAPAPIAVKELLQNEVEKIVITGLCPEILSILSQDSNTVIFNLDYNINEGKVTFFNHPHIVDKDRHVKLFLHVYQHHFNSGKLRVGFHQIPESYPSSVLEKYLAAFSKQHNECFFQHIEAAGVVKVLSKSSELFKLSTQLIQDALCFTITIPGNRKLLIKHGNILDEAANIYVTQAQPNLSNSSGFSSVMNIASNFELQKHCEEYVKKNGPLKPGQVAATPSGGLKSNWVIHSLGPTSAYARDKKSDQMEFEMKSIMRELYTNILQKAEKLKATSIVLPGLGSGLLSFNDDNMSAEIMIEVLLTYRYVSLKDIRLVILKETVYNLFLNVFINQSTYWTVQSYQPLVVSTDEDTTGKSCKHQ